MIGVRSLEWKKVRIGLSLLLIVILIGGSFLINGKTKSTFGEVAEVPIYSVDKEEKEIALTFDINWAENDYIYSILDTLDKYNVKGTFFVMGGWVNYSDENVVKLKKISERGHEIELKRNLEKQMKLLKNTQEKSQAFLDFQVEIIMHNHIGL